MNRKSQDSTDELLREMRALLEDDSNGASDEALDNQPQSTRTVADIDEDIAEFDAYMAALLGEVMPEEKTAPKQNAKKTTKSKKKKSASKKAPAPTVAGEGDAIVMSDVDAPEESQFAKAVPMPASEGESETDPADTQVEISSDVLGEQNPTIDSVYVTEQETTKDTAPFSVVEQLSIPTDSFSSPETSEEDVFADAPEIEESGALEDIPPLDEGYLPVEGAASATDEVGEITEKQEEEHLREGDIVLDAEDESVVSVIAPEEKNEEETPVSILESAPVVPTPVASPLDAARSANARAADRLNETNEPPRPKQSPLDALAGDRNNSRGNVSPLGGAPAFGRAPTRERSMSDDDVELLLDLGYENNLSQKLGAQRIETVKHRRMDSESTKHPIKGVYACDGEEYSGHEKDKEIRKAYRAHGRLAAARLVLTILLTLAIGFSDLLFAMFDTLPAPFLGLPMSGLYGGIGLGLLVLTATLSFTLLKRGVAQLLRYSPTPATVAALSVMITLLYDILGLFDARCNMLLNLPAALSLSALAIGECIKIRNERIAFAVVNSRASKIALYDMEPKRKKVIRAGHIVKIINDDADRTLRRVRHTERIGGYFRRTGEETQRYRALPGLLVASALCSVLLAVMTLLIKNDLRLTATVFVLAFQATLPVSALIAYVYPMLLTSTRLAKRGCAIIGDSAVDEYAKDSILLFDDTEMFRSKSSTEITIRGGGDTRRYIRYAKRLFATLGGTLASVTTSDLTEELHEERVEILRVLEQGLEACIDGKVRVMAGTSDFMIKNGIRVPSDSAELLVRRHVESSILYLAFDGKLRLGYEIDYRISGRFEEIANELAHAGNSVAVESSDPCIHAELLARSRDPGMTPIRVIKPLHFEKNEEADVIDSGVVATRSARDIATAVLACHRIAANDRLIRGIQYVTLLIGAGLCGAAMILDMIHPYLSAMVALAQLAWTIPCLLLSRRNMLNEQDLKKEHDKQN